MKLRLAVVVVAASGLGVACLSAPPYHGPDLIISSDDGTFVAASGFTLRFTGKDGFRLPDTLTIDDSSNRFGRDDMALCYDESGTGILLSPAARISGDTSAQQVQNQLVPVLSGPAVFQVRLDWATRFTCGHSRAPGGSSTFTVFHDGRIVRHDHVGDPSSEPITASQCECSPGSRGEFNISSYWTFAHDFQGLSGLAGDGSQQDITPAGTSSLPDYRAICLDGGPYQIGLIEVVPPPDGNTAAVFWTDKLIGHRVQTPLGNPTLDVLSWDTHSALFVEHSGCTAAFKRAIDYTMPPALMINNVSVLPSELDGMYGGDMGDGNSGIDVPDGPTTLTLPPRSPDGTPPKPLLGEFVVRLRFPRAVVVPIATRMGATPPWYVPQRVSDRDWIIWFRDPLQPGDDTITVRPD